MTAVLRHRPGTDQGGLVLGLAGGTLAVAALVGVAFAWSMENRPYDTWAAAPVLAGLVLLNVPLLRRAARAEADPRIARLLWWAFGLKLLSAIPRYVVAFDLYDGSADASGYSRIGADLARRFRQGELAVDLGKPVQGTGFIEILTGAVYSVTGATTLGGFFVFSAFSFWGLHLFHRAFVRAVPDGDHWRYARLVLLLPSLLFWPSSIGKEAWMCLGLGVMAWAGARMLTGARGGLAALVGGSVMLAMVRPHVAAIGVFAVFVSYLIRRPPRGASVLAPVGKLVVIGVLTVGMGLAVGQLENFLGVDRFDQEAVETTYAEVQRLTGQGGSEFVEDTATNMDPSQLPVAFANVMFRPFPWQASNGQALVSSIEASAVLLLLVASWRRIAAAPRAVLRRPYLALCGVYTLLFVYGFSAFSNAGILVRQRVQVLPFVLVLVCLPLPERGRRRSSLGRGSATAPAT